MSLARAKQRILESRLGDISSWSVAGTERTLDAMHPFDLRKGEKLPIEARGSDTLCFLVNGEALISINRSPYLPLPSSEAEPHGVAVPQQSTAEIFASTDCQLVCSDETELDFLAGWETLRTLEFQDSDENLQQRLALLKNPLVFSQLPVTNVAETLSRMQSKHEEANEIVIAEGDPATAFYIIESGQAEVWRSPAPGKPQVKVADLGVGDAFGEEALITGETRNATVRMTQPGVLLVLQRKDFMDLIQQPLVHEVSLDEAKRLIEQGHIPLDVGCRGDTVSALFSHPTQVIPLAELRQRIGELSPDQSYLTFCGAGRLGSVAALLLREQGIEAVSLSGGLKEWQ